MSKFQVIADDTGNVWAPEIRDCSIQRRNQKVIEESSSPVLTKEQADHLAENDAGQCYVIVNLT